MSDRVSVTQHDDDVVVSHQAFPCLTADQVEQIAQIAERRRFGDGELLWRIGDRRIPLHVILEGAVDIRQRRASGDSRLIVRHGPMGFSGDIDVLSDKAAVVEAQAAGDTVTLEVDPVRLKQLVVADSSISDVILGAFLARRRSLIAAGFGNVLLLGSRYSPDTFRIREFLERNSRPFEWVDLDSNDDVAALLEGFRIEPDETPVLIDADGVVHRNPTLDALARCMGLNTVYADRIYDVLVVGAGPAGLAASVYAASEGLDVMTVDAIAPGGQAGTSSKIENYLGFPTGISGRDLAQRAFVQAEKFGATLATPRSALRLDCTQRPYVVDVGHNDVVRARTVVIATGARYRRLPLDNAQRFEGRGIYFGATAMEARLCQGSEVAVVGGGNSAGQAAVYLSQHAEHVHVFIRSASLDHSMSRYLISRIDASPKITLHPFTEISALHGEDTLAGLEARDNRSGTCRDMDIRHAFIFIGAVPNTAWLEDCVALDAKGFVRTGLDLARSDFNPVEWPDRAPFLLETNRPGVFAAGDVRAGSTKRVASAVGEGSICVQFIHQALAG